MATVAAGALLASGALASAATVTVDGTRDAAYGSALTVQSNSTGFGDSNLGNIDTANGSELDAGYAKIADGNLYIFLAGNLESNFNKLDIFIDSTAGGENQLTPLAVDQGNFNRMADNTGGVGTPNGLTFDTGFAADRWISITGGNTPTTIFTDYANLTTGTGVYAGSSSPGNGTVSGGGVGAPALQLTWNNSNTAGVTGTTAPNDAASVATGIEVAIPLSELGTLGSSIKISAFVNGGGQDFLSNQVLGGLPSGTGSLADPRSVNFANIAGDQFVTVDVAAVPAPTSLAVFGSIVGASLLRRRRR
jgi:hypothetical protein